MLRRLVILGIVTALGGCAVDVGSATDTTAEAGAALTGTVGLLEIDRRVDEQGAHLSAAFARYQGVAEQDVLSLVGRSRARAELDSCVLASDEPNVPETALVELVDVGTLQVGLEPLDTRVVQAIPTARLVARTFPDVASVMAGVFYAGATDLPAPRAEADAYVVEATGGQDVGAFRVGVAAPSEVAMLVVGDGDGTIARDRALELSWLPGTPADAIEIEIGSRGESVVCTAVDDGAFRLEPALIAALGADADAQLSVRRVRVRAFGAEGLESAFARVAVTRSERVSIR